ncbi:MAG TPA: carboxypeptidase regulatory-like domain-containing protein [Chloroflexi bacterium]|nr:MAG: hypothetical protein DRI65_02630 [Chloroflexota bacterium]HDN05023.1 carboxypeptidase regulatory-like domain-containing protein [Chloroflexota bacterium]
MNTSEASHPISYLLLFFVVFALSSCKYPPPTPIDIPDGTCTLEDYFLLRLIEPEDGAFAYAIESVAGRPPNLRWALAAECTPGGFRVVVGTDEELNDVVISAEVDSEVRQFQIEVDLEVEREYYWTVELLAGELAIGNPPPFMFQTLPVPEGQMGVIFGRVWEDECDFSSGLIDPDNLPEGCVVVEGGVLADGVRDEDELGIPGVEVRVAHGKCPPTGYVGLASSGPTDENGYYYYFGPVGTYCVTVIPEDPGNNAILFPGTFSYPLDENLPLGTAYTEVTIESDGQIIEGINFGWDYVIPEGQPGVIAGRVWEDECDFPGGPIDPDNLPEGCVVVEGGVLADGVLDEDELGIPGVEVLIAQGECPRSETGVLASSGPTDENGYYYYFAPVGTYCVIVLPEDPGNDAILLPGTFSYPLDEYLPLGTAYTEVTIESDGQIFEGINFGWDYVEDDTRNGIDDSVSEGVDTAELEFLFSCISPPEDACENHYGSASQQCASIDEKYLDKCPQSYQGHQAIGVCDVDMGHDIFVEWVPYVVPPAINPVGECENLLQGTWSDLYTP